MTPPRKPPIHSHQSPLPIGGKLVKIAASNTPPPSEYPTRPLQRLMAMLTEAERIHFLQTLQDSGVEPNDPYLNILASHATIAQALVDAPDKVTNAVDELSRKTLVAIDRYLTQVKEAAVKEQEAAIATSVSRLLKLSQDRQEFVSWLPIALPLSGTVISLLVVGVAAGWLLAQFQRSPIVVGQPVHLNQAQVDGLHWLDSDEGKLARDIMIWNNGQIAACQNHQVALFQSGDVVVPGYGKVRSGACVLWVVPPGSRSFSQ